MSIFHLCHVIQLKVQRLVFLKEALPFFNPCRASWIGASASSAPSVLEMLWPCGEGDEKAAYDEAGAIGTRHVQIEELFGEWLQTAL